MLMETDKLQQKSSTIPVVVAITQMLLLAQKLRV